MPFPVFHLSIRLAFFFPTVQHENVEQFTVAWLREHCEEKPAGCENIAWYVFRPLLYQYYVSAACYAGFRPLERDVFEAELPRVLSAARLMRLGPYPVWEGLRFYTDKIGGALLLGVPAFTWRDHLG